MIELPRKSNKMVAIDPLKMMSKDYVGNSIISGSDITSFGFLYTFNWKITIYVISIIQLILVKSIFN